MSPGEVPASGSPEQVTATPPDPGRIPLPPLPESPDPAVPESFLRRVRFLDGALVALTLLVAFVAASFRASNTDLFLHLATGRLIAQGQLPFGSDPFTFTAQGVWANHSWLFDLGVFFVYSAGEWGGAALVVVKALAAAATAWIMLRTGSRPGQSLWVPAVFTLLAIVAMSMRLLLQPTVASMLLLAATLAILTRARAASRSLWLLPIICLAWVNLDSWYFLGPITVLLFLVGELLQRGQGGASASDNGVSLATLGAILVACVAACFANPYHVHGLLSLPTGLIHAGGVAPFRKESPYSSYFLSPLEPAYFTPFLGLSATGLAFHTLLVLGLLSFGLTLGLARERLRWWRVLIWLATALLAGWNFRAVPFFAVVAAPITALNFLDLTARDASMILDFTRGERRWAVSGRLFTAFIAVGLALLCVPGWLQPLPHHRRQIGWGVEVDPSLRAAALTVDRWHKEGLVEPGQAWFNLSPDAMYYFAWYCPGEKLFLDGRLELFAAAADDFITARKALAGDDRPGEAGLGWRPIFAQRGVRFVVFHHHDLARAPSAMAALGRVYSNPEEFVPCFSEGSAALFAWRDPSSGKTAAVDPRLRMDFNALAFGKDAEPAPTAPTRAPGAQPWWEAALQGEGATPPGSLTALQQTLRFDALNLRYQTQNHRAWLTSQITSLLGLTAAPTGPLGGGVLFPLRLQAAYLGRSGRSPLDDAARELQQGYVQSLDDGPVASLYLAIRAGRQGLVVNPDDVTGQFFLAEAYSRLAQRTCERSRVAGLLPHVQFIRQAQIAAALQNVLKVQARPEQLRSAHQMLASAFSSPEYFEPRVRHLREFFKLAQKIGVPGASTNEQQFESLKKLDAYLKEMSTQLKQRRDQYEVQSANKPILEKARIALENGLAETALNLLTRADAKDLRDVRDPRQPSGVTLALSLLLGLGRTDEVREALTPDPKNEGSFDPRSFGTHPLGLPAYDWFQVQSAAASGDYERADRHLAECLGSQDRTQAYSAILAALDFMPASFAEKPTGAAEAAGLVVGAILLREAPQAAGLPWQILRHLPIRLNKPDGLKNPRLDQATMRASQLLWQRLEQKADLWTLRAWLALEAGQIDKAREFAGQALTLAEWSGPKGQKGVAFFRSRPLTDLVLDLIGGAGRRD